GFFHSLIPVIGLVDLFQPDLIRAQGQILSHILIPNEAMLHRISSPVVVCIFPPKIKQQAGCPLSKRINLFVRKNEVVEAKDNCSAFVWHESKVFGHSFAPRESLLLDATVINRGVTDSSPNRQRPIIQSEIQRGIVSGSYRSFESRVDYRDISQFCSLIRYNYSLKPDRNRSERDDYGRIRDPDTNN